MNIKELSKIIQENGVVGAGGAGFPTYAKLDERANTILLNCAECEPLLKLHRQLLEQHAYEIAKTFSMVADTVGADEAIICIKKEYKATIQALHACIGEFPKVRIHLLDGVYPMGDEVVMIYEATKKVVKPGGLPIMEGVVVLNVETVYNIYRAIEKQEPVTDKVVSVVAEVSKPVTVRVPLGCTIEEVVALAGVATTKDPVYFVGGPMMGNIGSGSQPVTKTTNAVLVLPQDHYLVEKKRTKASISMNRAASICCQCQMCTDLCPRHALGHPIQPHLFMRAASNKDFQDVNPFINTMFCSSCGLCELYSCPQGLAPRSLMAEYKLGLRKAGVKVPQGVVPAPVQPSREYRKAPEERLEARLGLTKYNVDAPLNDTVVPMNKVKILLSQHIGAPAKAIVSKGDMVTVGQMIAQPADGLSVAIHASIDGKVVEVADSYVVIQKAK
ncbi:MAG: 4Fe-4S dicluster domain-containing protein [Lachnospiraceae bacterium]|nr:4Fe-4S dicluster domain-containing protein [Lachnospiraceae bacterium]